MQLRCSSKVLSPLRYESGKAERNATASRSKVLSPLRYESGKAERNAPAARVNSPALHLYVNPHCPPSPFGEGRGGAFNEYVIHVLVLFQNVKDHFCIGHVVAMDVGSLA